MDPWRKYQAEQWRRDHLATCYGFTPGGTTAFRGDLSAGALWDDGSWLIWCPKDGHPYGFGVNGRAGFNAERARVRSAMLEGGAA